ncbi:hypothetical protein TRIUR3_15463 [Triticum urartu]|uniref:Uncharacterized protein n=1 Tax=Triticum urartu TaxID=4572 RepID=M8B2P3_TRIUA|nr:hypothetical protein TRIUR3_15463 [Triticum urartu]
MWGRVQTAAVARDSKGHFFSGKGPVRLHLQIVDLRDIGTCHKKLKSNGAKYSHARGSEEKMVSGTSVGAQPAATAPASCNLGITITGYKNWGRMKKGKKIAAAAGFIDPLDNQNDVYLLVLVVYNFSGFPMGQAHVSVEGQAHNPPSRGSYIPS